MWHHREPRMDHFLVCREDAALEPNMSSVNVLSSHTGKLSWLNTYKEVTRGLLCVQPQDAPRGADKHEGQENSELGASRVGCMLSVKHCSYCFILKDTTQLHFITLKTLLCSHNKHPFSATDPQSIRLNTVQSNIVLMTSQTKPGNQKNHSHDQALQRTACMTWPPL